MEVYRHPIVDTYCVVVYADSAGKLGLVINEGSRGSIKNYWENNEKGYNVLEIVPIQNTRAYLYHSYWNSIPKGYRTSQQRCKKFDFYKYVLSADISDKYRDKEYFSQVGGRIVKEIMLAI